MNKATIEVLQSVLKTGDMVLTTPTKKKMKEMPAGKRIQYAIAFFFIRLVSACRFIHVVMVDKVLKRGAPARFYSTEPPAGTVLRIEDLEGQDLVVRRRIRPWTIMQAEKMRKVWFSEYHRKPYDIPQLGIMLISWLFRINRSKELADLAPKRHVCSTTQAGLERATGVNTYGRIHTDRVNPGDCIRNKFYRTILKVKKGRITYISLP